LQNAEGSALGPFDSYLLLRGLKTLKHSHGCQQRNATLVADFLAKHPKVAQVFSPAARAI